MAQHRLLAGRYELGDRLGAGGMATVYRAFDHVLSRPVAVKVLHDATVPAQHDRILREARAAAGLGHPNAVTVFDAGIEDETPYLVLELVEGQTLADRLATGGPLPPAEAVRIASAVLGALQAAHVRGLIHRDVKPANVLLGHDGEVRLADFGIARDMAAGATLTATGQFLGTPAYVAPEQIAGQRATAATDLYGVGILLYEMLAGEPPFRHESALATALAHEREFAAPLAQRSAASPALAAVVHQALEKDPAARFVSAGEMSAALQDAARRPYAALTRPLTPRSTQPMAQPTARSPAGPDRTQGSRIRAWPWTRRILGHPVALVAAALLLLAAAGFAFANTDPGRRSTLVPMETAGMAPAESPAQPEGTRTAAPVQTNAATPPPQALAEPRSLSELIALLAEDPRQYGEKGPDLVELLIKVAGAEPDDQPKEARKAVEEAQKWTREGKLDSTATAHTVRILGPLAAEDDSERGRGRDRGEGGERGDDDDD